MTTRREETVALLKLAMPIAVAQLGQMTMGLIDTAIVGHVDKTALAGMALGNSYAQLIGLLGLGFMLGLDPVASQRMGAREYGGAWRALGDAFRLAVILTPVLLGLTFLIDHFLVSPSIVAGKPAGPFGADPEVARVASGFLWARAPGLLPFMMFGALRSWLYAAHATRVIILTMVAANVANFVLDLVFVHGDPGLVAHGLPALGIPAFGGVGAGIVTSTCITLSVLAILPGASRLRARQAAEHAPEPPRTESHWVGIARIARLGLPIGVQISLEMGIFGLVAWLMPRFGTVALGGHQIAISVASTTFMVAMAFGAAASVRVGNAIGRGDQAGARRSGLTAIGLGFCWMGLCSVVLFVAPELIGGIFTDDPEVVAAGTLLVRIAALFQLFDGAQVVASGALRGAGDIRIPMLANLVAYWVIALPVGWFLAFDRDLRGPGLWYGLTLGLFVVGTLLVVRFSFLTRTRVERVA